MRFFHSWRRPAIIFITLFLSTPYALAEGQFVVLDAEIESAKLARELKEMQGDEMLQLLADSINELFVIPEDVGLRFSECEESNAYFSAEEMEITMCVELLADMDESLSESYPDEDERHEAVAGAFTAILLHEVGHALVSVLEIPITGREEDAVDQLSAWVLIEADMADAVLSSAETYYNEEEETDAPQEENGKNNNVTSTWFVGSMAAIRRTMRN